MAMNAKAFAEHVFSLMQTCGWPYMSPELNTDIPDCPPQITVWDEKTQMIRVISFADNLTGIMNALDFSRDTIQVMDKPEFGWPEAWVYEGGNGSYQARIVEGWDDPPQSR